MIQFVTKNICNLHIVLAHFRDYMWNGFKTDTISNFYIVLLYWIKSYFEVTQGTLPWWNVILKCWTQKQIDLSFSTQWNCVCVWVIHILFTSVHWTDLRMFQNSNKILILRKYFITVLQATTHNVYINYFYHTSVLDSCETNTCGIVCWFRFLEGCFLTVLKCIHDFIKMLHTGVWDLTSISNAQASRDP